MADPGRPTHPQSHSVPPVLPSDQDPLCTRQSAHYLPIHPSWRPDRCRPSSLPRISCKSTPRSSFALGPLSRHFILNRTPDPHSTRNFFTLDALRVFPLAVAEIAKNFRPSPIVFAIGKKGYLANVVSSLVFEERNPTRNMKFVAAFREAVTSSQTKKDGAFDAASEGAGSFEANDGGADAVRDKFAVRLKTNQKGC